MPSISICGRMCMMVVLAWGSVAHLSTANEYRVASAKEIKAVRASIRPGDVLVMVNGNWHDQRIVFKGEGTAEQPITLRAETPGQVVLTGESALRIEGKYLLVSGVYFKEGKFSIKTIKRLHRDGKPLDVVAISGRNCRLTDSAIDSVAAPSFISVDGAHHRVDHCYLGGKKIPTTALRVRGTPGSHNHWIDHNHFGPPQRIDAHDEGAAIDIDAEYDSEQNTRVLVEQNLIERHKGASAFVRSSTSENVIRANTFLECAGTVTLSDGLRTRVESNYFIAHHRKKSGGICIVGGDHTIINNYLEGLADSAFRVYPAKMNAVYPQNDPENEIHYSYPANSFIAFNTVVDARAPMIDVQMNSDYVDYLITSDDRDYPTKPDDVSVINNIYWPTKNGAILSAKAGSDWTWKGNMTTLPERSKGVHVVDLKLEQDENGVWRPRIDSPARGGARGQSPAVPLDIDGQNRLMPYDVGCDQQPDMPPKSRPLTAADVGPSWLDPAARQPVRTAAH